MATAIEQLISMRSISTLPVRVTSEMKQVVTGCRSNEIIPRHLVTTPLITILQCPVVLFAHSNRLHELSLSLLTKSDKVKIMQLCEACCQIYVCYQYDEAVNLIKI